MTPTSRRIQQDLDAQQTASEAVEASPMLSSLRAAGAKALENPHSCTALRTGVTAVTAGLAALAVGASNEGAQFVVKNAVLLQLGAEAIAEFGPSSSSITPIRKTAAITAAVAIAAAGFGAHVGIGERYKAMMRELLEHVSAQVEVEQDPRGVRSVMISYADEAGRHQKAFDLGPEIVSHVADGQTRTAPNTVPAAIPPVPTSSTALRAR